VGGGITSSELAIGGCPLGLGFRLRGSVRVSKARLAVRVKC